MDFRTACEEVSTELSAFQTGKTEYKQETLGSNLYRGNCFWQKMERGVWALFLSRLCSPSAKIENLTVHGKSRTLTLCLGRLEHIKYN